MQLIHGHLNTDYRTAIFCKMKIQRTLNWFPDQLGIWKTGAVKNRGDSLLKFLKKKKKWFRMWRVASMISAVSYLIFPAPLMIECLPCIMMYIMYIFWGWSTIKWKVWNEYTIVILTFIHLTVMLEEDLLTITVTVGHCCNT